MTSGKTLGVALHIGADLLTSPERSRWPMVRSCRDSAIRLSRLCAAAGLRKQRTLLGADSTCDRVRDGIAQSAAELEPGGLFVLTFSGHSERGERDEDGDPQTAWCLYDGALRLREVAEFLALVAATARVVV